MSTPFQAVFSDSRLLGVAETLSGVDGDLLSLNDHVQSLTQQNGLLEGQLAAADSSMQALRDSLAAAQAKLDAIANTSVFDDLEFSPWLLAPGTAANTGSTGNTTVATQAQPGINSAWFNSIPGGPFANAYWYKKLGADAKKTKYLYELAFMFATPADAAASQAVELDIQQVIAGVVYNTGLQFDFAENALRVWNRSTGSWIPTGRAAQRWSAGQWMSVAYETHRDGANVYMDSVTVNGTKMALSGTAFPAPKLGLTDMLNCAVQLDGNKTGTAYRVYLGPTRFTAS